MENYPGKHEIYRFTRITCACPMNLPIKPIVGRIQSALGRLTAKSEKDESINGTNLLPPVTEDPRPKVLFVCTGNYYRSRFAEALFNFRAHLRGLSWRAFSSGLAVDTSPPGLSPHTRNGLRLMQIPIGMTESRKRPFAATHLETATRCIALQESEHRPMFEETFPELISRIEFWDVPDIQDMAPADALSKIRERVDDLVEQLLAEN